MDQAPILSVNDTILWLKAALSAATLAALYARFRRTPASGAAAQALSVRTKVFVLLAVLFSFGVFHNLGNFRGGSFIHYGEMFHYYLGPKYFKELGYYDLYKAVIVADSEQGNTFVRMPFFTDLRTYQNAQRATALLDADRLRGLFTNERWSEFKHDVAFFKQATQTPNAPGLMFLLMDHGYNGSPLSTLILGTLTNAVPVTRLMWLALLDVFLVIAMGALVFRTFGFEMGALFAVYFCVNVLNAYDFVSGGLLRYDWLFYLVAAICLLERKRYAASACLLTLSTMTRVFPAMLFYGIAVAILLGLRATRTVNRTYLRFIVAAAFTCLALFLLPAASLGSVLQPWLDFASNTDLHNQGVYVNHLGLRSILLFEPSHLSLEAFVEAFRSSRTNDIVRHWQDIKEYEFTQKKPLLIIASLLVLSGVTAVIRKRGDVEKLLWPLLLVYTMSHPAHYYYAFLCLLVLLFFRRHNSLDAFVPLALLLVLNLGVLVTDAFRPSPIVFYTLVNIYLFLCLTAILAFEIHTNVFGAPLFAARTSSGPATDPHRMPKPTIRPHRRKARGRRK
ncbi:MAG: hypothetical protein OEZ06_10915 [Myxococcales bacterium]|nr:hypothetical protein [Myxococcales bacterium]